MSGSFSNFPDDVIEHALMSNILSTSSSSGNSSTGVPDEPVKSSTPFSYCWDKISENLASSLDEASSSKDIGYISMSGNSSGALSPQPPQTAPAMSPQSACRMSPQSAISPQPVVQKNSFSMSDALKGVLNGIDDKDDIPGLSIGGSVLQDPTIDAQTDLSLFTRNFLGDGDQNLVANLTALAQLNEFQDQPPRLNDFSLDRQFSPTDLVTAGLASMNFNEDPGRNVISSPCMTPSIRVNTVTLNQPLIEPPLSPRNGWDRMRQDSGRQSSSPASYLDTTHNAPIFPGPNQMHIRCKFGQLGMNPGMFNSPHGFCLGFAEEIVVADTQNHRIQVFDTNGNYRYEFGQAGKEEGSLWYPRKVAVSKLTGNFIICDRGGERSRMQIFSRTGHFIRKIPIRFIDIVAGLAINKAGDIVAVDSVTPTVFVISEAGVLIKYFECREFMSEPSDIGVYGNEYYICDFKGHSVVVISDDGRYIRRIGSESVTPYPNGIDISDAGDVLIGDSHGNQFHVAVFSDQGNLLSQFTCPSVKVSRCCGLKITSQGYVVTLAKNNHHVLVLNTLYVN